MRSPVQIRLAAPHSRKASLATPRKLAGCLRLCLRLCLRVAKIRTFTPLLVLSLCSETIALLSDFCSAGWAAHAACSFLRTSGFCVVARTGFSPFANAIFSPSRKLKIFTRGPRSALRELRTQIRWRKIRYSVAALLTNPVSSSTQPQGIISNTPQKSVGCLRLWCLRVAKIRTFAPLLVPLRCAGTIALLSDFCSAGWAAPAAFLSQGIISNTPQVMRGVRFLPHAKNQRFFPRGPRLCLRLCPTKCPRFAAVLCGDPVVFPQKKNARHALAPRFFALFRNYRVAL